MLDYIVTHAKDIETLGCASVMFTVALLLVCISCSLIFGKDKDDKNEKQEGGASC